MANDPDQIARIEAYLSENLSPARFKHILGVRETAVALAKRLGIDTAQAELAALLHDCAKERPDDELLALAKRHVEAANVLKKWQSLPGIVRVRHDGQMTFEVIGIADTQCDIEASVDLKKWSRVDQVTLENGRASFLDARRIWLPHCFYRAKAVE